MTTIYHGYTETLQQVAERYHKHCARAAYHRLVMALGHEKADRFIGKEMLTCSWREIRTALEMFADLAEKQVSGWIEDYEADYKERADLYELGMGR